MSIEEQVYSIVQSISRGKVMSYGQIGAMVGVGPRQVGRILHNNPDNSIVPCHRVVRSNGTIASGFAFGGADRQKEMLMTEGVVFEKGKVKKEFITGK